MKHAGKQIMIRPVKTLLTAVLAYLLLGAGTQARAAAPAVGEAAPAFRLQDQNGEWQSLDKYQGQWVVLYFYPKDDTPGCTTEACNFRDDIFKFRELGAQVLGVSLDEVSSHQEFAEKYHLPFPLLADSKHEVATAYGVLSNYLGFKVASRETFLIDPQGRIAKHYEDVDPETHSDRTLADLKALQTGAEG